MLGDGDGPAGEVVQLDPPAGTTQAAPDREGVERQRPGAAGVVGVRDAAAGLVVDDHHLAAAATVAAVALVEAVDAALGDEGADRRAHPALDPERAPGRLRGVGDGVALDVVGDPAAGAGAVLGGLGVVPEALVRPLPVDVRGRPPGRAAGRRRPEHRLQRVVHHRAQRGRRPRSTAGQGRAVEVGHAVAAPAVVPRGEPRRRHPDQAGGHALETQLVAHRRAPLIAHQPRGGRLRSGPALRWCARPAPRAPRAPWCAPRSASSCWCRGSRWSP